MFQACKTENASCYSGGFIDDLSGPNRITITASNETSYSWGDIGSSTEDPDGLSEFSEGFFDALYGYNTEVDRRGVTIDWEHPINAEFEGNGFVSMQEAFTWAYEHDDARWVVGHYVDEETGKPVDESPWFDSDGNWLPTHLLGRDILDEDDPDATEPVHLYRVFTLIVSCSSGGYTVPLQPGSYEFKEGTIVMLNAYADTGYHFVWWAYSTSMISY